MSRDSKKIDASGAHQVGKSVALQVGVNASGKVNGDFFNTWDSLANQPVAQEQFALSLLAMKKTDLVGETVPTLTEISQTVVANLLAHLYMETGRTGRGVRMLRNLAKQDTSTGKANDYAFRALVDLVKEQMSIENDGEDNALNLDSERALVLLESGLLTDPRVVGAYLDKGDSLFADQAYFLEDLAVFAGELGLRRDAVRLLENVDAKARTGLSGELRQLIAESLLAKNDLDGVEQVLSARDGSPSAGPMLLSAALFAQARGLTEEDHVVRDGHFGRSASYIRRAVNVYERSGDRTIDNYLDGLLERVAYEPGRAISGTEADSIRGRIARASSRAQSGVTDVQVWIPAPVQQMLNQERVVFASAQVSQTPTLDM